MTTRRIKVENKIKKEIVYTKAKPGKRLFAHFVDISFLFLTTAIFFSLSNMIMNKTPLYIEKAAALVEVKNETGLYVEGKSVITYVENNPDLDSYAKKKDELSSRIDNFYANPTYFKGSNIIEKYNNRKLKHPTLFEQVGDEVVEKDGANDKNLYKFYANEIEDYSMGCLARNPEYVYLLRFEFYGSIVQIAIILTLFFTTFYLIIPLTFGKRGRQTLGMKLSKIGLICIDANNEKVGKYIGRFFFMFLVFIPLNIVGLLLPSMISTGMMFFTKTGSSLPNYVFNDYMVDVTNQKIYLDDAEREEASLHLCEMNIENQNLLLK